MLCIWHSTIRSISFQKHFLLIIAYACDTLIEQSLPTRIMYMQMIFHIAKFK